MSNATSNELFNKLLVFIEQKKPIFIHGKSGVGKTTLIKKLPNVKFISINDRNA